MELEIVSVDVLDEEQKKGIWELVRAFRLTARRSRSPSEWFGRLTSEVRNNAENEDQESCYQAA